MSERVAQHRNETISSLLKVEAFQLLAEELQKEEQQMSQALVKALLFADSTHDPQRTLDQHRGFVRGLQYAMAAPRRAQRNLRGEVEEEEEAEVADGWATWAR